jgi:hypothetical protein
VVALRRLWHAYRRGTYWLREPRLERIGVTSLLSGIAFGAIIGGIAALSLEDAVITGAIFSVTVALFDLNRWRRHRSGMRNR